MTELLQRMVQYILTFVYNISIFVREANNSRGRKICRKRNIHYYGANMLI